MKLEQQVCSLELAKKLKELGVKQESYFYWIDNDIVPSSGYEYQQGAYEGEDKLSLFTVAELGEMLPAQIWRKGKDYPIWLNVDKNAESQWNIDYTVEGDTVYSKVLQTANTEADARAKMLIYLLENNLITPFMGEGKQNEN